MDTRRGWRDPRVRFSVSRRPLWVRCCRPRAQGQRPLCRVVACKQTVRLLPIADIQQYRPNISRGSNDRFQARTQHAGGCRPLHLCKSGGFCAPLPVLACCCPTMPSSKFDATSSCGPAQARCRGQHGTLYVCFNSVAWSPSRLRCPFPFKIPTQRGHSVFGQIQPLRRFRRLAALAHQLKFRARLCCAGLRVSQG